MSAAFIGLDLAKSVFQVHGVDVHGKVVVTKRLRRDAVLAFFANLAPCVVGMEACSGVTVHVPPGRMQPIDSPMIFKELAWYGGLPSDSVCDSLGRWNPKTNLT